MNNESRKRIAIVGCGAVTEKSWVPALCESRKIHIVALVDKRIEHAEALRSRFELDCLALSSLEALTVPVDCAIVATPSAVRVDVASQLLPLGIDLFLEKPAVSDLSQYRAISQLAERHGRRVGAGLVRRYLPDLSRVGDIIASGMLGNIEFVDYAEGGSYTWPVAGDAAFLKASGGGVFLDLGGHVLDTLCDWLGACDHASMVDDAIDGVEANCLITLSFCSGATARVRLSRTHTVGGGIRVRGSRGSLIYDASEFAGVQLRIGEQSIDLPLPTLGGSDAFLNLFRQQLQRFLDHDERAVLLEDAMNGIEALELAANNRQQCKQPWTAVPLDQATSARRRIVVIGAAGFVGVRLVETLLAQAADAEVIVVCRSATSLAHLARRQLNIAFADIRDGDAVKPLIDGADWVINLSYGKGDVALQNAVNVDAVAQLAELCVELGVPRLVHISTISAVAGQDEGLLDEDSEGETNEAATYGNTKYRGELRLAQSLTNALTRDPRMGTSAVILRPTIVYGPWAPVWTMGALATLKAGPLTLPEGGLCNAVHVDDVVQAILLAGDVSLDPGACRTFMVSGKQPITWQRFYQEMAALFDLDVSVSTRPLNDYPSTTGSVLNTKRGFVPALRGLVEDDHTRGLIRAIPPFDRFADSLKDQGEKRDRIKRLLGVPVQSERPPCLPAEAPVEEADQPLPAPLLQLFASRAIVNIDRAQAELGYVSRYSHPVTQISAMQAWAAWINDWQTDTAEH
ncbi:NAD-dependent epimerase/dehydratase family protein [Gammaproteobacteria bacterium]|nr:NAD-dependent epimerase/dehydratase family protein [Gammaproteobacteria bacterium]